MIRIHSLTRLLAMGVILSVAAPLSQAQSKHSVSVQAEYAWTHTNLLPGCHCFGMQGGDAEAEVGLSPRFAALADVTVTRQASLTPSSYALTQTVFSAGLRYSPRRERLRVIPFAELLLGAAHASGTLSPSNGGYGGDTTIAFQTGGGLPIPLTKYLELVPVHLDYLLTNFGNGAADRQNQLRFSGGLRFEFHKRV